MFQLLYNTVHLTSLRMRAQLVNPQDACMKPLVDELGRQATCIPFSQFFIGFNIFNVVSIAMSKPFAIWEKAQALAAEEAWLSS